MIRQTNLAQTIDLAAERARYDECAKKLLTYKAVIAWILKSCTREFSQYDIPFICEHCLKENVEILQCPVHPEQPEPCAANTDQQIEGMNTESGSIKEQTVYYDIRFRGRIPGPDTSVQLIINLEIQLNDTPGYPLVTRGFYYCARMISEQYGTVFTNEHYEKLQKVYSIWICPDPAKKRKNGIFQYRTIEEELCGVSNVNPASYDLMEVVILNLGDADQKSEQKILNLLNVLFSASITPEEKKRRLQNDFNIAMTAELESEVHNMCNLSQGLIERGVEQGIEQGIEQEKLALAQMMFKEKEPLEKIRRYTGYTIEKLHEIAAEIK